jgi:hypothetical protein
MLGLCQGYFDGGRNLVEAHPKEVPPSSKTTKSGSLLRACVDYPLARLDNIFDLDHLGWAYQQLDQLW